MSSDEGASQTAPGPAARTMAQNPAHVAIPASLECPACGYPIPSGAPRCPECGYACSADEWAHSIRRDAFIRINRGAWIGPIVLCGVASLFTPFFITLAFLLLYLAATALVGRKFVGLYRRLLRQIWLVSLPWLLLPWLVFLPVLTIAPEWIFKWMYPSDVPRFLRLSGRGAFGGVLLPLGVLTCNLLCWVVWRWRWRTLCNVASLPAEMQRSGAVTLAVQLAYLPASLLAAGVFLSFGVMNILDWLIPSWDQ